MSADDIERVTALAIRAEAQVDKGHLLRGAELFGRAFAACARATSADNLVSLHLRLQEGSMHCVFVGSVPNKAVSDPSLAPHRAEFIKLLSGAVAALDRRRATNTLLEGKCTAMEEAWRAAEIRRYEAAIAADAASWAALVGYKVFMHAGTEALNVFTAGLAGECSAAQLQSFVQFTPQS